MERINTTNKEVDLFGGGKHGFRDGNPGGGIFATFLSAAWFNALQEEVANVVEGTGIALNSGDRTQLQQAIQRMIAGGDYKPSCRYTTTANIALTGTGTQGGGDWPGALTVGDRVLVKDQSAPADNGIYVAAAGAWARAVDADAAGELTSGALFPVEAGTVSADTVWMLTTDGTITIGTTSLAFQIKTGDATTTRKGLVQLATSAEAQAYSDATKPITPSTLAAALQGANRQIGGDGYQKLPGGLILQWGSIASTAANATRSVTLPLAFPTAGMIGLGNAETTTTGSAGAFNFNSFSSASVVVFHNSSIFTATGKYIVIGS